MLLVFAKRNPRYALACAVGVLLILLIGASQHPSVSAQYKLWQSSTQNPLCVPCASTDLKMVRAEEGYQQILENRRGIIEHFGPSVEEMGLFPLHGEVYTLFDFFIPDPRYCAHGIERIGIMVDGGKWTCGLERIADKPNCVVYSLGVNGESSFEAAILKRTRGCEVWGYDYSVSSFGPEITLNPDFVARSTFRPYRIGSVDAPDQNPPSYTLRTLLEMNHHTWIDVLKVDIERSEFDTLAQLVKDYEGKALPFGQLQVEIHAWNLSLKEFLEWFQSLEKAGLRPFWIEPNLIHLLYGGTHRPDVAEYAFINIHGRHELITDNPSTP